VTYDVELSEQAKTLLEELHRNDRRSSRELALLLLRLEKDPRPNGSRELTVQARPQRKRLLEERVWDIANFRILYRLNGAKRMIEVGLISRVG
jgi:mRNA-degrading endonuclease RelE of RelBE toxin-antitoxin system